MCPIDLHRQCDDYDLRGNIFTYWHSARMEMSMAAKYPCGFVYNYLLIINKNGCAPINVNGGVFCQLQTAIGDKDISLYKTCNVSLNADNCHNSNQSNINGMRFPWKIAQFNKFMPSCCRTVFRTSTLL
jgi:hypothetical protein